MSNQNHPLGDIAALAIFLSMKNAAEKQRAAALNEAGATTRESLADFIKSLCKDPACKVCHPAPAAKAESSAADNIMASAGFSQPESTVQPEAAAPQESVSRSAGTSLSACRAVGLTDADTGTTAQLKGAAAMLITSLEGVRDTYLPGNGSRATAETHIAALAQALRWALDRIAADAS